MITRHLPFGLITTLLAALPLAAAPNPPSPLAKLQAELRARDFARAIATADAVIAAKGIAADQATYLKALALFHAGNFAAAETLAAGLPAAFPQSTWGHKAVFLSAQALIERKKFAEAAAIYAAEAGRILAPERKQALANEILRFAAKLETKPDPATPDAPPPDFAKAYSLYTKALAMELPRDFRDDIQFRKARAGQEAGNLPQAINDFQAYLTDYDPAWTGPAGSGAARLPMQNPPPAGKHVALARFHLAEVMHGSGNGAAARMELEDLLKRLAAANALPPPIQAELATPAGQGLAADIRWLMVQTYFAPRVMQVSTNVVMPARQAQVVQMQSFVNTGAVIGNTGGLPARDVDLFMLADGDLDMAIKACREYISAHPAGSRAVRAAWMIAEAMQGAGRADDAIAAYRDIIAGKGFRLPDGAVADAMDEEIRATPATHLANLKMRAVFRIGQIQAGQKKFPDAIATWQGYIREYPNGTEWADSQNAIINAEFQMGLDALLAKDDALALRRFEEFLRAHPLDDRAPRILYLHGAIHEAAALDQEQAKAAPDASAASYRRAIDEWTKLVSKYPDSPEASAAMLKSAEIMETRLGEFEKALKLYQKLANERGNDSARAAIARLTAKSLEVSATKVFRTTEKPVIHVKSRNIEQCEVRVYSIDLQAYFRKMHVITGVDKLDVSLIQPDKTWTIQADGYAKYKPLSQEVEIPMPADGAGATIITVTGGDLESTVLVLRSDLEMVVKSSRREVFAFVQDMRTGKPAAGVDVLVSTGKSVAASGKTDADGVFRATPGDLKDLGDVRVFALRGGHATAYNLPLAGLQLSGGLAARGFIHAERPVYLPGELVNVRGILRDVADGSYVVPANREFKIRFHNTKGQVLSEQTVAVSKFGTFAASLQLPDQAAVGEYAVTASQELPGKPALTFTGKFTVREFKLEKVRLAMDFPRRVYFRGESVEIGIRAEYYWGEPLAGGTIRCALPDGRTTTVTTDARGMAKLAFDTTGLSPGSPMIFRAMLDSENVQTVEIVVLAKLGFTIKAEPSQDEVIAGESVDLRLTTTAADGKPCGENLRITIARKEIAATPRILGLLPWPQQSQPPAAEVIEADLTATTDPATGKVVVPITPAKSGEYVIRASGTDRQGQPVVTRTVIHVSGDDDATRLRLFADSATLKVGQDATVRLHSRLDKGLALITWEGESILHHRIIDLHEDYNIINFATGHGMFPNFRLAVAVIDGRELREASKEFTVERELKVAVKPGKDAWLPGEQATIELVVTDQSGKPVEAELSLSLVNEALFAVAADPLPSILDCFHRDARRHAGFHVGATCDFRYVGITRAVSSAILDESNRLGRVNAEAAALIDARKELESRLAGAPPAPVSAPSGAVFANERGRQDRDGRARDGADKDELERFKESAVMMDEGQVDAKLADMAGRPPKPSEAKDGDRPRVESRGDSRWLPALVTGADGKATATITMPESTTAWRLTVYGCTVETMVGQATATTLTRKDFFVSLKAPSFLREGDTLRVIGRVHNLGDFAGDVPVTLRARDARAKDKVLVSQDKLVKVAARAGAEICFDGFVVPAGLDMVLEMSARAGAASDALQLTVPVLPWGLPVHAHAGGSATSDTAAVLDLPVGRKYESTWMTLSVGPDIRAAVLDMAMPGAYPLEGVARIMPPPWGDHPGNDLLAVASALAYANSGRPDGHQAAQLADRARALVAALVATQGDDGGWTAPVQDAMITSRVFWALVAARDAGIPVEKSSIDKAAACLLKQLEGFDANDHDRRAIVLHALSTDKRADFAACNRLYRDRQALGTATLAYLARAFHHLGRAEVAAELAGILEAKAVDAPGQPVRWDSGCKIGWMNDSTEATALVLLALAESKPDSPRAAAAAQSLLHQRGCFGFPGARSRGPAVAALSAWFGMGKEQSTDMEIDVHVNGKPAGTVKATHRAGLSMIEVPRDLIAAGKNTIEFKMRGRGRFAWAATLTGFSSDTATTGTKVRPGIDSWRYLHAPLEYRGRSIGVASSSEVKNLPVGDRVAVRLDDHQGDWHPGRWFTLDIPLPAGARLVDGTLKVANNARAEVLPGLLRVTFTNRCPSISYELGGQIPGQFRVLPCTIREIGNPAFLAVGPTTGLTVLAPGEKSPDPYVINIAERFALGKCHFDDGDDAKALDYLAGVFAESRNYNESELARMLLWLHTKPGGYDARKIVEMFEILRERYPKLEIPFDKILVVGKAYQDIGEHERAWLVYRAVISASFANDSSISAVLEDEGRFLGSVDFQYRLWREYPDTAEVVSSCFALSQLLYQKAAKAHMLPKEDNVQPEKVAMLTRAVDMLLSFLALYPKDPLADDAGFSLCNAMLDLKDYPMVVALSREFAAAHATSDLAPGFQYMTALGLFWQKQHGEALAAAKVVADGTSKDRDFARYILGQIHHAEGKPAEAITWYGMVKDLYPDAAEAIAYFEKQSIGMDEVTILKPGAPVAINLKYRNIKDAIVQVYRVDLMKLYLQQKNLSAITSVQLAGIKPEFEQAIALGTGKDYVEKDRMIPLALKDEAAYLVICRGDDLFTSGMVLITPLKIEVQEDAASGRVRANVLDTAKGGYRPAVHVKAIGSKDHEFRSGETDLRGLFIADNLRGTATVIAREGNSRYAFFRGTSWLGAPENAPAPAPQQEGQSKARQQVDYNDNLMQRNDAIQQFNGDQFDQQRRQAPSKGVKAEAAY